jgi:hypothetical protein
VGSHSVRLHLPIGKNGEEVILHIVGEGSAIGRIGRRPLRIKAHQVRQQSPGDSPRFLRCVAASVLQRVRKSGDETGVARRLRNEVSISLIADEKGGLVARCRDVCLPIERDRSPFDDRLTEGVGSGRLRTLDAAQSSGLRPAD